MPVRKAALTYCEITSDGQDRAVSWPLPNMEPDLSDFTIGTEVGGRYVLRYKLGQGGMGCVFLAHDNDIGFHDVTHVLIELRFDLVQFVVDEANSLLSLECLRLEIELVHCDPFFHFLLLRHQ